MKKTTASANPPPRDSAAFTTSAAWRHRPSSRNRTSSATLFPRCVSRDDFSVSVYLVTDRRKTPHLSIAQIVEAAVCGDERSRGATIVQLRDKDMAQSDSLALGRELKAITDRHGVPLIINDDVHLAAMLHADGVHLGQDDASVKAARDALGEAAIVGVSAGTPHEARRAILDGADYVGVGAVFGTSTKADAGAAIGPAGLAEVVRAVDGRIPVVAIGGVGVANAHLCRDAGADGVAVASAVMGSARPGEVSAELTRIMTGQLQIL